MSESEYDPEPELDYEYDIEVIVGNVDMTRFGEFMQRSVDVAANKHQVIMAAVDAPTLTDMIGGRVTAATVRYQRDYEYGFEYERARADHRAAEMTISEALPLSALHIEPDGANYRAIFNSSIGLFHTIFEYQPYVGDEINTLLSDMVVDEDANLRGSEHAFCHSRRGTTRGGPPSEGLVNAWSRLVSVGDMDDAGYARESFDAFTSLYHADAIDAINPPGFTSPHGVIMYRNYPSGYDGVMGIRSIIQPSMAVASTVVQKISNLARQWTSGRCSELSDEATRRGIACCTLRTLVSAGSDKRDRPIMIRPAGISAVLQTCINDASDAAATCVSAGQHCWGSSVVDFRDTLCDELGAHPVSMHCVTTDVVDAFASVSLGYIHALLRSNHRLIQLVPLMDALYPMDRPQPVIWDEHNRVCRALLQPQLWIGCPLARKLFALATGPALAAARAVGTPDMPVIAHAYVDDFIIASPSREVAERALAALRAELGRANMQLNDSKTVWHAPGTAIPYLNGVVGEPAAVIKFVEREWYSNYLPRICALSYVTGPLCYYHSYNQNLLAVLKEFTRGVPGCVQLRTLIIDDLMRLVKRDHIYEIAVERVKRAVRNAVDMRGGDWVY